jgi:hypothetical protein
MDADHLVGRDHVMARLSGGLDRAVAGRGLLVMVEGEAGIGKTAVLEACADIAVARGTAVAWGQSWDAGVGVPYWPWVQVLRSLGDDLPRAAELAGRLLHERPDSPASVHDRFELFEEIRGVLVEAGTQHGVLVVLDDLHWADQTSLAVLAHVTPLLRATRVLIAGARRTAEAHDLLDRIARRADRVLLDGLHDDAAVELVDAVAGRRLPADVVAGVVRQAAGNPMFARELVWLIAAGHDPRSTGALGASGAVADVVTSRVAALSAACRHLLIRAALLGHEHDIGLLARLEPAVDLAPLLHEAVAASIVVVDGAAPLRFTFRHPLFREVLLSSMSQADRAAGHVATLRRLEALVAGGATVGVGVLAGQAFEAAAAGAREVVDDAVRYERRTAARATELAAFEDAVVHLRRALSLLAASRPTERDTHAVLLTELGVALDRVGDAGAARETLLDAVAVARESSDATLVAEAAVALHRLGGRSGLPRDETVRILDEVVSGVAEPGPPRARLLAALARELHHTWDPDLVDRSRVLAADAVVLARDADDPETLALCLLAQHDVEWALGTASRRLQLVSAMLELAESSGDRELIAQGQLLRATARLELGDPGALDDLARACRTAEALGHARGRWLAMSRRAVIALVSGRLDEAESEGRRAAELGVAIGEPDASGVGDTMRWELARLRGRPIQFDRTDHWVPSASWPPHQAIVRAAAGDRDGAIAAMEGYSLRHDLAHGRHRHDGWVASVVVEAALLAGSSGLLTEVYDSLLPLAGLHLVYGGCMGYGGAVDHHLALLAAALGRPDLARSHLADAIEAHRRLGAAAWTARDEHLRDRLDTTAVEIDEPPAAPAEDVMQCAGEVWFVTFRGRGSTVRHSKGMFDLAVLLQAPGREVHALELMGGADVGGAPGAQLDDQARRAYRSRIRELQEDIDEARLANDWARADSAETELDALVEQLSGAFGLSGRARPAGSASERARVAVTHRIKAAIRRLTVADPDLGRHLTNAVRTGTWCAYRPEGNERWTIDMHRSAQTTLHEHLPRARRSGPTTT